MRRTERTEPDPKVLVSLLSRLGRLLRTIRAHLVQGLVNDLAPLSSVPASVRVRIYRWSGIELETDLIGPGCFFGGSNVAIGKGTFVNIDCVFDNVARITVGDDCAIGHGVMFCTSSHRMGTHRARARGLEGQPIVVGSGCWIGARATILPGVTIGEGCVVAACSVVTEDCAPDGLYAGSPARRIRNL